MRISIEHTTRYRYEEEATYAVKSLLMTPASFDGQAVIDWHVDVSPDAHVIQGRDGFGNRFHLATIETPHREAVITAGGTLDIEDRHGIVRGLDEPVPVRVFLRRTPLTMPSEALRALTEAVPTQDRLAWLHGLMTAIRERVDYIPGVTNSSTTAAEALEMGQGVCQDHAHLLIAAARTQGVPARYVTGYMVTDESEAAAHHAWAEAWVEALGWVGFDVANRTSPTDRYVRLACGLDASEAAPIRGSRHGGSGETMAVEVKVQQQSAQQ